MPSAQPRAAQIDEQVSALRIPFVLYRGFVSIDAESASSARISIEEFLNGGITSYKRNTSHIGKFILVSFILFAMLPIWEYGGWTTACSTIMCGAFLRKTAVSIFRYSGSLCLPQSIFQYKMPASSHHLARSAQYFLASSPIPKSPLPLPPVSVAIHRPIPA